MKTLLLVLASCLICIGSAARKCKPCQSCEPSGCVDFQQVAPWPQTFTGPHFGLGPLGFINPVDASGHSTAISLADRPEDKDGKPELYVGHSSDQAGFTPLVIKFGGVAFPRGVCEVRVDLQHWARAVVLALDKSGAVAASATQNTAKVRGTVVMNTGNRIAGLKLIASETALYRICWVQ